MAADPTAPVIITSTGRTGTIFFANLLQTLFPDSEVYHERGWSRLINMAANAHLGGVLPQSLLRQTWRFLKQGEIDHRRATHYIEVSAHLYAIVVALPEIYQRVKIIHIVRDPRTYVRSHLNWARHRPKSFVANYLTPFWQPNMALCGQLSWRAWLSADSFARFCWIWRFKNSYLRRLPDLGGAYLCVRFEDFFGSTAVPGESLNHMLTFMGLPPVAEAASHFRQAANVTEKKTVSHWTQWDAARCRQLQAICGAEMAVYGYGNEPAWQAKLCDDQ